MNLGSVKADSVEDINKWARALALPAALQPAATVIKSASLASHIQPTKLAATQTLSFTHCRLDFPYYW